MYKIYFNHILYQRMYEQDLLCGEDDLVARNVIAILVHRIILKESVDITLVYEDNKTN